MLFRIFAAPVVAATAPVYGRKAALKPHLIALFFCCLLAILIFDQTETDLRTAQPAMIDEIQF